MSSDRSPASPTRLAGTITILLTLASWTSIPLFLRYFAHEIDGWSANGWRYGFSALLWLPVLLVGLRRKSLPPGLWKAALWPSIFNAAAQVAFGLAPYYVDASLMAFSLRLQIVFVTTGAAIMFAAERKIVRSPGFLVGIFFVVAGTVATIILRPSGDSTNAGMNVPLGVSLSIGSGLLYAAYALSVRRCMHGMPPMQAFAAVSQYTALVMVGLMLAFAKDHGMAPLSLEPWKLGLLLLSAIIGIGVGHTLYFYSIGVLGLAVSAGVVQLQPVTVSIAAPFLFPNDPHLTPLQWTTGMMAVAGAAIMLISQHRAAKAAQLPPLDEFDALPVDEDVALVAQSNEAPKP